MVGLDELAAVLPALGVWQLPGGGIPDWRDGKGRSRERAGGLEVKLGEEKLLADCGGVDGFWWEIS